MFPASEEAVLPVHSYAASFGYLFSILPITLHFFYIGD
jgi:hypothetical protein